MKYKKIILIIPPPYQRGNNSLIDINQKENVITKQVTDEYQPIMEEQHYLNELDKKTPQFYQLDDINEQQDEFNFEPLLIKNFSFSHEDKDINHNSIITPMKKKK